MLKSFLSSLRTLSRQGETATDSEKCYEGRKLLSAKPGSVTYKLKHIKCPRLK